MSDALRFKVFAGPLDQDFSLSTKTTASVGFASRFVNRFAFDLFAMTMGTGVLALLMPRLSPALLGAGRIVWLANIFLFVALCAAGIARLIQDPKAFFALFKDPKRSMFFGTLPMGLATIGNGTLIYGSSFFGHHFAGVSLGIFIADAVIALASGFLIPHLMFTMQSHSIEKMTAIWLLPIVPAEVTSVSGGLLIPHLGHATQVGVLWSSAVLWTLSVPIAMLVLGAVLIRLVVHGIPEANSAVTSWLTLGPLGTGAAGMLLIGSDAKVIFAHSTLASTGAVMDGVGLVLGLVLWGFGLWWWVSAIALTIRYVMKRNHPFNLGWWGFTFPLGVMTIATYLLGQETNYAPISDLAKFMTLLLIGLWIVVATLSAKGFFNGSLPAVIETRKLFYEAAESYPKKPQTYLALSDEIANG